MKHEIVCGHQCIRIVMIETGNDESLPIPLCLSDNAKGRVETQVKHSLAKTASPVCGPSIDGRSCNEMVDPKDMPNSFQSVLKSMGIELDLRNIRGERQSRNC